MGRFSSPGALVESWPAKIGVNLVVAYAIFFDMHKAASLEGVNTFIFIF